MKVTITDTLLATIINCALALMTPGALHDIQCCETGYITAQYFAKGPTCADAQAAYRALARPEADATCGGSTYVCAFSIPPCEDWSSQDPVNPWKIGESLSSNTSEKVQLWDQTFEALAKADGLTKKQSAVLQAASKLGTFSYFEAKTGSADWKIQVQATSNAILEAAFETLPADLYGAVWSRFQLAPGASQFATVTPLCNCAGFGTACTVNGVAGICARATCKNCGFTGLCSVP